MYYFIDVFLLFGVSLEIHLASFGLTTADFKVKATNGAHLFKDRSWSKTNHWTGLYQVCLTQQQQTENIGP